MTKKRRKGHVKNCGCLSCDVQYGPGQEALVERIQLKVSKVMTNAEWDALPKRGRIKYKSGYNLFKKMQVGDITPPMPKKEAIAIRALGYPKGMKFSIRSEGNNFWVRRIT